MNNFLQLNNPENLMLVNVIYHRPTKNTDYNDCLDIIYRDLTTGQKHLKSIESPTIDIYFTKDEYKNYNYNKTFIEKDKVYKKTVLYREVDKAIAEEAQGAYIQYYYDCIKNRNFQARKNLHKYRYVFSSDMDIESWYRCQWFLNYDNDLNKKVTRIFADIEVDIIDCQGFPEDGEHPISLITAIDAEDMISYTFIYNDKRNPKIEEFKNRAKEFVEELNEDFDDFYGKIDYKILMYNDEREMLAQFFALINTLKRDFCTFWNMRFDIPYIIARCEKLGMDVVKTMCHPDFKFKEVYYKRDRIDPKKKQKIDVANRGDFLLLSSYTYFTCQLVLYAGLRKGRSELRSFKLNAVAAMEIGDAKLDYHEESNLRDLPYMDFWMYVKYNIKDVLLQMGVDNRTSDFESLYIRSYTNGTKYDKVFKQTTLLKNRGFMSYWNQGLIKGNNVNIDYASPYDVEEIAFSSDEEDDDDDDDVKFGGALVGDPRLNSHTGKVIMGQRSMYIFSLVVDFDFSAMYPNTIIAFNIAPNTMIGKLIIPEIKAMPAFDYKEPPSLKDKKGTDAANTRYDAGQDFMDNLLTENWGLIGSTWFNLPIFTELCKLVEHELVSDSISNRIRLAPVNKVFVDEQVVKINVG